MPNEINLIDEVILNAKLKDLNPMFFGYQLQFEGKNIAPRNKNFTIIHYIEKGRALFTIGGISYDVGPGEAFIMPQGITAGYKVTKDMTVKYIGFDGELSRDFSTLPPVIKDSGDIFDEIISAADYEGRKDIFIESVLIRWYLRLFPQSKPITNDRILRVKEYIDENYMRQITVENIAKMMHMNRSYLSRIFKEKIGMTIREYLISVRLKEAKHLLNDGKNVTEVAILCGFGSQSHFSKTFKKHYSGIPKNQKNVKSES